MPTDAHAIWDAYKDAELKRVEPILIGLGYALDPVQIHLTGERYLLSADKLVLTGRASNGVRLVVKASSQSKGRAEIIREHRTRQALDRIDFAYLPFRTPRELAFVDQNGLTVLVTEFIEEARGFLAHSLQEQFALSLNAFKMQEGVQATTYGHTRQVRRIFGMKHASDYRSAFEKFVSNIEERVSNDEVRATLGRGAAFLTDEQENVERYAGFLTHADFVPHNFRIKDGELYLLDHTSLTFGNKYESWARFLNYMTLYHPALERALTAYVRLNRSEGEMKALRAMRVYKLGFLVDFYARSLDRTDGNLRSLAEARILFWARVMQTVLDDKSLPDAVLTAYQMERDALRGEDEKARQRAIAQL